MAKGAVQTIDGSLEADKDAKPLLNGVPSILESLRSPGGRPARQQHASLDPGGPGVARDRGRNANFPYCTAYPAVQRQPSRPATRCNRTSLISFHTVPDFNTDQSYGLQLIRNDLEQSGASGVLQASGLTSLSQRAFITD